MSSHLTQTSMRCCELTQCQATQISKGCGISTSPHRLPTKTMNRCVCNGPRGSQKTLQKPSLWGSRHAPARSHKCWEIGGSGFCTDGAYPLVKTVPRSSSPVTGFRVPLSVAMATMAPSLLDHRQEVLTSSTTHSSILETTLLKMSHLTITAVCSQSSAPLTTSTDHQMTVVTTPHQYLVSWIFRIIMCTQIHAILMRFTVCRGYSWSCEWCSMHELEFLLNHRALRSFTVKCIFQWPNGKNCQGHRTRALHPVFFEPLHLMVSMATQDAVHTW